MSLLCKRFSNYGKFINRLKNNDVEKYLNTRYIGTASHIKPKPNYLKLSLFGLTAGALIGTGFSIYKLNKATTHIINEQATIEVLENVPRIKPSRKHFYPGDLSGLLLTLYQYQTCPFCCKVRAFLDYYGISYNVVEVDPVLRQSIKWSPYKKVPILVAEVDGGYQPLNDSSMIISALQSYLQVNDSSLSEIVKYYPSISYEEDGKKKTDIMNKYFLMFKNQNINRTKESLEEERKWRKWVDEVLVHTLSPNVYRTMDEAIATFNWFSETGEWEKHFPTWERYIMIYVGAGAMWLIGKRLKTRHNLNNDVRESLYDECNKWMEAVNTNGTPFLGGNDPNLADLSVYGVLNSIEGCEAFKDVLKHSEIKGWYFAMKEAVITQRGSNFA